MYSGNLSCENRGHAVLRFISNASNFGSAARAVEPSLARASAAAQRTSSEDESRRPSKLRSVHDAMAAATNTKPAAGTARQLGDRRHDVHAFICAEAVSLPNRPSQSRIANDGRQAPFIAQQRAIDPLVLVRRPE